MQSAPNHHPKHQQPTIVQHQHQQSRPLGPPVPLGDGDGTPDAAAVRLEKPSCLQLTSVHTRPSTTSTITSDYFSMNSRETNSKREEDVLLETRCMMTYIQYISKSPLEMCRKTPQVDALIEFRCCEYLCWSSDLRQIRIFINCGGRITMLVKL